MKKSTAIISIIVALAAGYFLGHFYTGAAVGAIDCNSNTCFSSLGVTGLFEADGTTIFTGATSFSGVTTFTGAIKTTSQLTTGGNLATTTNGSETLQQSDLIYSTISMTPIVAAMTVTLPASSTLTTFLPNAGDSTMINFINASTTAAITITLAGGTGSLLQNASTSKIVNPGSQTEIFATRKGNTDIIFSMVPTT